jgi:hypothetical protein
VQEILCLSLGSEHLDCGGEQRRRVSVVESAERHAISATEAFDEHVVGLRRVGGRGFGAGQSRHVQNGTGESLADQ